MKKPGPKKGEFMMTPQEARKLLKAREAGKAYKKAYEEQQKKEREQARKALKDDIKEGLSRHFSRNREYFMTEIVEPKIKRAIYEEIPFFIIVPLGTHTECEEINSRELANMHERIDEPPYDIDLGEAICSAFNKVKADNYDFAITIPPEKLIECSAMECAEMTIEALHDLFEGAGWNIAPVKHYFLRIEAGKQIPYEACAEGFQIFFE